MNLLSLHLPLMLSWRARPSTARPAGVQVLLGQFQRNLLFAGTGLLSVLMLAALALMVGLQMDRYHGHRLDDFARVRLSLEQELGQHELAQVRLANMAEFAWTHQAQTTLQSGEALRDRYLEDGEHLVVTGDARSGSRTALGVGTAQWPSSELERYLQLSRSLSLIGRLTGDDDTPADNAYFFDPSGLFLSLPPGVNKGRLQRALGMSDRQLLFALLRMHASLPSSRSVQDQIPTLHGVGGKDRPRLSSGPHPLTGVPSLVSTFYARDRTHPIGVFVTYEPMHSVEQLLRRTSGARLSLIDADGHAVAATDGPGLPPQPALRAVAMQADFSGSITTLHRDGYVMLASNVAGTPWVLVESYGWRDVLEDGRHLLGSGSLPIFGSLIALWALVLRLNKRWLRPALAEMDQVYANGSLYRTALEQLPMAVCLQGTTAREPLLSNPAMQALNAWAGSEGLRLNECLRAGHAQQHHRGTANAAAVTFPLTLQSVNGDSVRHLRVSALDTEANGTAAALFAVQDVTALVGREEEQQRRRELAESESRAKSAFLATVSHEIRTPLYGILGHLELLDRPGLEAPLRLRIQRIRQSADSLLDIIRDVLDLSRMEFEPLDIEPVVFEPEVLLERVALLFAPLAYAKGVDLDYSIEASAPSHMRGQEEQVERVLRNLTSNAVKFTSSGRVELRVRLIAGDDAPRLCFEVADSGVGLSDAQQERLFQPFTQADESIRTRFGGSGLGLFLCRQLCESMGGSIRVQSTLGVGTLFTFEVPIEDVSSTVPQRSLSGRSVLLLSASHIWRAELGRRLQRWGAQVQVLSGSDDPVMQEAPPATPLVVFERGEAPLHARLSTASTRPLIRVRVDGPLQPSPQEGSWVLSAYSAEALLHMLERTLGAPSQAAGVDGDGATPGLELSQMPLPE